MAELAARTAAAEGLPLTSGGHSLTEHPADPLWSIMPWPGHEGALVARLETAGLGWPGPGEIRGSENTRLLWAGRDEAWLIGRAPEPVWAEDAALIDISDAALCARLSGPAPHDVLARLVPVDLRPRKFGEGRVLRTLCAGMTVTLVRLSDAIEIFAMRSMAESLIFEIGRAMASLDARRSER